MSDFARLEVWSDPRVASAMVWYRAVAGNHLPAKFRIAATVPVRVPPDAAEEELWRELTRATPLFLERWQHLRTGGGGLGSPVDGPSLLELCNALVQRMLSHCNFCAWNCRIDRRRPDRLGACKLAAATRVSTHFHHPGEELVYRGTEGSGTIFFTSCNMRCAFCQNGDISTDKDNGEVVDARALATMAWLLRMEGCHNVNWVGGEVTIHSHRIVEAIALLGAGFVPTRADLMRARATKADRHWWYSLRPAHGNYAGVFNAPMLWNSNFFMTNEAMQILRLLIDVWLPDFKFGPGRCAISLARTPRYFEVVTENLLRLRAWGEDLSVRHLVMPGHVECCTYPVLDWLAEHMPDTPVNIMDQYHPDNFCDPRSPKYQPRYSELARRPARSEVRAAYNHARRLGLPFETVTFDRRPSAAAVPPPGI